MKSRKRLPWFAGLLGSLHLAIGPFFAIPRTATNFVFSVGIGAPCCLLVVPMPFGLFGFTLVYFACAYLIAI